MKEETFLWSRRRTREDGWYRDSRKDVADMILNKEVQINDIIIGRGYVGLKLRDITLYCGYISPNVALLTFEANLDSIFYETGNASGSYMVVGDFNANSQTWGSPITDRRGEILGDWIAALDLTVINDGLAPTCETPNGHFFIDITMATRALAHKTLEWKVLQEETVSTHKYILFGIAGLRGVNRSTRREEMVDFNKCKTIMAARVDQLETLLLGDGGALTELLKNIKREATVTLGRTNRGKTPYWWSQEVEQKWRLCNTARRRKTRIPER